MSLRRLAAAAIVAAASLTLTVPAQAAIPPGTQLPTPVSVTPATRVPVPTCWDKGKHHWKSWNGVPLRHCHR